MDAGRMETPFDYFFHDRTNPRTIGALKGGPLASALEAYARRLHEDGYATHSGFVQLRLLGCFNRWLDRKGLTSEDVDAATIERYLRGRAQSRKLRRGDSAALFRLLTMLRPEGSGVTAPPPTPVEAALGRFQHHLRQERSLSEATVINYTPVARLRAGVESEYRGSHVFRHYAASRTMPRVGVRAAIHRRLNCGDAA
jgi:hypothetical protein